MAVESRLCWLDRWLVAALNALMGRPQSAPAMARIPTPPRPQTPQAIEAFIAERAPKPTFNFARKSAMQRSIDGELGPKMTGVIHYPYSTSQRIYLSDFRAMVAGSVTHPYATTALHGSGSIPHNILSGSNFDDDRVCGNPLWHSEQERAYPRKSLIYSKTLLATGVRSECTQFC